MGQRLIVSESEKNSILNMHNEFKNNSTLLEQKRKGKLFFAFDNDTTDFQGFICSDGYLYPYAEDFTTWKVGPIAKVPYTGSVLVTGRSERLLQIHLYILLQQLRSPYLKKKSACLLNFSSNAVACFFNSCL